MPLGAARLTLLAFQPTVAVVAEVIRKKVGIIPASAAQIVTADSQFGGSSFDSVHTSITSYLTIKKSDFSRFNTGTGAFTVEGWFKPTSPGADGNSRFFYFGGTINGANSFGCSITTGGGIFRGPSTGDLNFTKSNTGWLHYAFVYDGTNKSVYCDGTRLSTTAASLNVTDSTDIKIGSHIADSRYNFDGYIDELRVSDIARYTGTSYSVPTTTFVNDDDTILLLHMDGSNGSQFFDDDNGVGRSAVGVKAIGNAQIDTAQYKFGGSSALFDGTGDLLQASTDASLTISSSEDFTIEGWIRPGSVSGVPGLLTDRASSGSLAGVNWDISIFNGSYLGTRTATLLFETGSGAGNIIIISNNNVFTTNTWYHFAVVRSSNVISLYVNGVDVTNSRAGTQSAGIGAGNLTIGGFPNGALMYSGHFDEIRWSNTARYTSGFTAPTAPFVNDDNTKLLLHCDGTDARTLFLDDNGTQGITNTKTITANGNAQLDTAQYKFGGSSALFDGTGDYLTFNHNITATDDFVFEGWVRFNALPSSGGYSFLAGNSLGNNRYFAVYNVGGTYRFETGVNGTSGSFYRWWNTSLSTGTWYHWALVKNGTSLNMYQDGSALSITGSSGSMTQDKHLFNGGTGLIAAWAALSQNFNGWMDEIRISNTARYTSGFTPSTEAFENDANTVLLLHMDGSYDGSTVFIDSSGDRTPIGFAANGNAQIDTAQSKIGGSSLLLDGTGDYLSTGSSILKTVPKLALNYDYWTVEYWLRINSHAGAYQHTLGFWNATAPTGVIYYFSSNMYNGTNKMGFQYKYANATDSGSLVFGSALSTGVWQHHAFVRNGNTLTAYLDGVSQGTHTMTGRTIDITGYNSTTISTMPFTIGAMSDASGGTNGWMDEIRISDVARYTSGFTPQTTPFQNDANTVFLLHCDGSDGSTDFVDDNGVTTAGQP